MPTNACLIADKYGISKRALTELAASFLKIDKNKNLNQYNLSENTIWRRRNSTRLKKAEEILNSQIGGGDCDKQYVSHWDSKSMKSLSHVQKDVERVCIVLTGKWKN